MKKQLFKLSVVALIMIGFFACKEEETNQAPAIESITLAKTSGVVFYERIKAEIKASDPDGDALTYTWSATKGSFEGTGAFTTWIAPNETGTCTITCTVSDGKTTAIISKDITVLGSNYVETPVPPTIYALTPSKATDIIFNEKIGLNVNAIDLNYDVLTYTWTVSGGTIDGTGENVNWTAPNNVGKYTITCTVSDGKESVARTIEVEVVGSYYNLFDKLSSPWQKANTTPIVSGGIVSISSLDGTSLGGLSYPTTSQPSLPYSVKTKVAINAADRSNINNLGTTSFYFYFTDPGTSTYLSAIYFRVVPCAKYWRIDAITKDGSNSTTTNLTTNQQADIFKADNEYHTIGMSITIDKILIINIDGLEIYRGALPSPLADRELTLDRFAYYVSPLLTSLSIDNFYFTTDNTILK